MTQEEKIALIADAIEMEAKDLQPNTALNSIDTWDSMAKLSMLAVFSTHFKKLGAEKMATFETIGDILQEMDA